MAFRNGRLQVCRSKSRQHERFPAHRRRDGFRNVILNREDVTQGVIEPPRPFVIAAGCIDELHGDAPPVSCLAHAALHYGRDGKLASQFAYIHGSIAKPERTAATRDAQPLHAIERVDQFLRQALAEIALVSLRTQVGERQHGDCRRLGRGRAGYQGRNKAVAVTVSRCDKARLARIVRERLAQLLNAGRERIIAHDRIAPH
jgi:hypothetical protein